MYSTKLYHPADIPYEAIVLIEPPMIDRAVFNQNLKDRQSQIGYISKALLKQQSVWSNLEEARAWFKSRPPWNTWNENAFDLFMVRLSEHIFNFVWSSLSQRNTGSKRLYRVERLRPGALSSKKCMRSQILSQLSKLWIKLLLSARKCLYMWFSVELTTWCK